MPERLSTTSPAKINLYLRVKKKRADGFHEITTLFERIDLCDRLDFLKTKDGKITVNCPHPEVPTGPKNLVHKAAVLLKEKYGVRAGIRVKIDKAIPVAAGLAGGSSNAATTLLALNRLWQLNLSKERLIGLSRAIGSDVAFFIHDCSWALGTGRGDVIKPLKIPTKLSHFLVVPRVKLYAAKVYGAFKFKLTAHKDNANILIHRLRNNNINDVSSLMVNDLESVILRKSPNLAVLKRKLKSLDTQGVMISGSGPATFALAKDAEQAEGLKKIFDKRYSQTFVVRTL